MSKSQTDSRGRKRDSICVSDIEPSTKPTGSKSTSPYDRNFQQNLIDHGVYPDSYEYPDGRFPPQPANWEEINGRLLHPRASLSSSRFSADQFRKFQRADARASKEDQVTTTVIPIIEGDMRNSNTTCGKLRLTNLDHLTDGTLVSGNPDRFYGARPEQLDRRIRAELNKKIVPSTQADLPIVPNFLLAVKGPDGNTAVAKRQACYDGALGARGIQALQSYGQSEPVYDNNAYTITASYSDGQLKLYTCHPSAPSAPGTRPEYYMNQLRSFAITDTPETFRQGATAYRNAGDWTKEMREGFIETANGRLANSPTTSPSQAPSLHEEECASTAGPVLLESDTPAGEPAMDEPGSSRPAKRPRTDSFQSRGEMNRDETKTP